MSIGLQYPDVTISGPLLCFDKDPASIPATISDIHTQSFADTVNTEIKRLDGYYIACSDWLNNANVAQNIARHMGLTEQQYAAIATEEKYLSNHVLERVQKLAHEAGHPDAEIARWQEEVPPVNVKNIARQRMLMMQSVLHSTPIIMRDPFADGKTGEYGFGDGKTQQIFEGKAKVAGMGFSAIASPKLHGYVFRFAVSNVTKPNGFHDNNPAMMLDNKIVDNLEAWNKECYPGVPMEKNPLMENMAQNLYPNVHDWIHSWLLYDVNAKSDSFKQWGADIFFNVEHLVKNKLVINYELLSMSMHRYVWNTMFDSNPELKDQLYDKLENYLDNVHQFAAWEAQKSDPKTAKEQEDYLAYAVLSNLCFVLDPKEARMQAILERYPPVREQMDKILGKSLTLLHSDIKGVPSQLHDGDVEEVASYVMRYPMQDEIKARLKTTRIGARSGKVVTLEGDPRKRIYTENMAEYENLPEKIKKQIVTIRDSNTYGILNKALAKLPEAARNEVVNRVEMDDAGRMFFRIERDEIDLSQIDMRTQDKRVLLVRVPKGEKITLHPRVKLSLLEESKRQMTTAGDTDVVAFNISDEKIADQILAAGHNINIPLMIKKAKQLAASGHEGSDDIYPLSAQKAVQLFGFKESGFYESLDRERFAAQGVGPLVMKLQDGSDQKLFNGVMVYISLDDIRKFNADPDPDVHFTEQNDFIRTHKSPSGTQGIRPFELRPTSKLADLLGKTAGVSKLHGFLESLNQINRTIDYGEHYHLAQGLFT